jgi:hypothetical protein
LSYEAQQIETCTQWPPQHKEQVFKEVFPKPKDFSSDFGWTQRTYVLGETGEIRQIEGTRAMFTLRFEVDDEARPTTQTHGRNQRKTPQTRRWKIGWKYSENHEKEK